MKFMTLGMTVTTRESIRFEAPSRLSMSGRILGQMFSMREKQKSPQSIQEKRVKSPALV